MEKLFYQVLLFIWRGIVGLCVGGGIFGLMIRMLDSLSIVPTVLIVSTIPIIVLAILFFTRKLNPIGYLGMVIMVLMAIFSFFQDNELMGLIYFSDLYLGIMKLGFYSVGYYAGFIITVQYFFSNNPQKGGENVNQIENKSV